METKKQLAKVRQPGELSVQIFLPGDLGIEVGKIRVTKRSTNSQVISELIRDGLRYRGVSIPEAKVTAAQPAETAKPSQPPQPKALKLSKNEELAKAIATSGAKGRTLAEMQAAQQLSLPAVVTPPVAVAVEPAVEAPILPPFNIQDPIEFKILATEPPDLPIEDPFASVDEPAVAPTPKAPKKLKRLGYTRFWEERRAIEAAVVAPTPAPAPAEEKKPVEDLPLEDPFANVD